MKKHEAINILRNQISKLKSFQELDTYTWTSATNTYLNEFLNPSSSLRDFFHTHYWNTNTKINDHTFEGQVERAKNHLNECIELIENLGLYKLPKKNILYHLPNWLIVIIFSITSGLIILVSTYLSSNNNLKTELENKKLKDSISLIRKIIPQVKHKDSIK